MDHELRIYLFGGFLLEHGNAPLPPIPSKVGKSLFAYLVTNAERVHTRELLAGVFWPDLPESRARRRLSHTLWQIQSVLAEVSQEPFVEVTANTVQFNRDSHYWFDVEEFEESLASAQGAGRTQVRRLERAVGLYRGDFLAGFYDDWIQVDQEQRREQYFTALSRLVRAFKSLGDNEEALVYARRLAVADPLREDAHRDVMRLCSLLDRFNEAVAQYDLCAQILDEELGAEPGQETRDLLQAISDLREKGEQPFTIQVRTPLYDTSDFPLVGRTSERAVLIERLEDMFAGRGGVVLVEGEPGIGKTRLLTELSEDANWRGVGVLWGACPESSRLPYEAVRQALTAGLSPLRAEQLAEIVEGVWLREVSRIVPELAEWLPNLPETVPLRAGEGAGRMREAVTRVITALGQINESLVVIDDIQWADDDTLQMLLPLAERLQEGRVLLCLSYRSTESRDQLETWQVLRKLDSLAGTDRLQLGPLTAEETDELVRRSTGASGNPPELVSGLFQETGGNPFFLLEMMRAMFEAKARVGEKTSLLEILAQMGLDTLHEKVAEIIGRRIRELGTGGPAVLAAAAVHSGAPTIGDLARIGDVPRSQVLDVLDAALNAKIMYESSGRYRFWHQLFRKYVAELIDPIDLVSCHLRAGELFEDEYPDDVEALAHHFSTAGEWDRGVAYLAEAGRRAVELYAYETAAQHYGRAAGHGDEAGLTVPAQFELLVSLEQVLDVLGRRTEQEDLLERMLGLAQGAVGLAYAHRRYAWLLAHTDRFEAAQAAAEFSLECAGEAGDPGELGSALTVLAMTLSWSGQVPEAVSHLEAAVAHYVDQPEQEADTRTALGSVLTRMQRYREARAQLDRALETHRESGNRRGEAESLGVLATLFMEQGEPKVAEEYKRGALDVSRAIGYRHGEALSLVNLGNVYRIQDRVGEAMRCYRGSRDVFASIRNSRGEAWARANAASLAHSFLGDDVAARRDALAALEYFESIGHPQGRAICHDVLGGIARRAGDHPRARHHYAAALDGSRGPVPGWTEVSVRMALALLELEEGDTDGALEHVSIAEEIIERGGMAGATSSVQAVRGLVLLAAGQALEAFAVTADACESLDDRVDQGYLVAFRHFQVCLAADEAAEARRAIDVAYDLLNRSLGDLDEDDRRRAFEEVPEHAAIQAAWLSYQPTVKSVRLPRSDAPGGRPLADHEFVAVEWTVSRYEDRSIANRSARRRQRVARLVMEANEQGASPRIEDLADALEVSVATVRRDLSALRSEGLPVRTRGTRKPTA